MGTRASSDHLVRLTFSKLPIAILAVGLALLLCIGASAQSWVQLTPTF